MVIQLIANCRYISLLDSSPCPDELSSEVRTTRRIGFYSRARSLPDVGIVLDYSAGRRCLPPPTCNRGAAPYSPHFILIGSQDLDRCCQGQAPSPVTAVVITKARNTKDLPSWEMKLDPPVMPFYDRDRATSEGSFRFTTRAEARPGQYLLIHSSGPRSSCALGDRAAICPPPPGPVHEPSKGLYSLFTGATVAEQLARSPPTKANRVQSPAGSPDLRKWESCWTMSLVDGFSRGSPVSPVASFCSIFASFTHIGSQDLASHAFVETRKFRGFISEQARLDNPLCTQASVSCSLAVAPETRWYGIRSSETDLLTNSQCDNRAEHPPRRRHRGANLRSSDYKSATLPLRATRTTTAWQLLEHRDWLWKASKIGLPHRLWYQSSPYHEQPLSAWSLPRVNTIAQALARTCGGSRYGSADSTSSHTRAAVRLGVRNLSYKFYFYSKAPFTLPRKVVRYSAPTETATRRVSFRPPLVSPPPPEQTRYRDSHESARATRRRRASTQLTIWSDYSPANKANRVRFPAGSLPEFRKWESRLSMPLVGGFSQGSSPPPPPPHSGAAPYQPRLTLVGSRDLHINSRPNLSTLQDPPSRLIQIEQKSRPRAELCSINSKQRVVLPKGRWRSSAAKRLQEGTRAWGCGPCGPSAILNDITRGNIRVCMIFPQKFSRFPSYSRRPPWTCTSCSVIPEQRFPRHAAALYCLTIVSRKFRALAFQQTTQSYVWSTLLPYEHW
ncbi:hypothetical protein PR048_028719 [Dryococelus australis]|uniref:Uncharacterized protein n=1 Tax=Dryococelus australis TaxID=614101 RepID=A0ABQ9GBD0_9NEOP|nr:hypothetical protein PR048_028719 [Dryococelus australis]